MNNTEIKKIINTVDENNIALRNSLVAFDNVCNSLQSERLHHSITFESLKKMVNMVYNRFGDDFTLDELEALERAADLIGDSGIALAVHNRIEKGNYI